MINEPKRVVAEVPNQTLFHDYRFIVETLDLSNKVYEFKIEINCPSSGEIHIRNCDFKHGLIIRISEEITFNSIYIYHSEFNDALKLYGDSNSTIELSGDVGIDSCRVDKLEIIGISSTCINIYKSDVHEILMESNTMKRFVLEKSDIGLILDHKSDIEVLEAQERCFKKYNIVPKKIYKILRKRYLAKDDAIDASLRTIDMLLNNKQLTNSSLGISCLYYERNRIQEQNLLIKSILWLFGYFHSPARYLTTSIIFYSLLVALIGLITILDESFYSANFILNLAFNTLFGLSNTFPTHNNSFIELVLSIFIGIGTVLYSGLLVTLMNRFRIRF